MTSNNGHLVFFDLETSGREPGKHHILQFAAIAVDAKTLVSVEQVEYKIAFHVLDDPWEIEAMRGNVFAHLTGYTGNMVAVEEKLVPDREEFIKCVDVWNKRSNIKSRAQAQSLIDAFLNRHKSVPMVGKKPPHKKYSVARLAGHNIAAFDIPHLRALYGPDRFFPCEYRCLDTYHLACWVMFMEHGMDNIPLNMPALLERFGIKYDGSAHDALVDVKNNLEVARRLLFKIGSIVARDCIAYMQGIDHGNDT